MFDIPIKRKILDVYIDDLIICSVDTIKNGYSYLHIYVYKRENHLQI